MNHLPGASIVSLMRKHGKTIRSLAASMGITHKRVRHVRAHGVKGAAYVQDWMEAITGDCNAEWAVVACARG